MELVSRVRSIDEDLALAKELVDTLRNLEDLSKTLRFLTVKEMCKLTGWGSNTVQELYNRPDFPSCNFGKEKVAEIHAVINYFSVPRRR